MRASTVHTVLVHCRINCLSHIEQVSGEPMRRYECDHSGSLIHVGVTKFVNTPDGSGWRYGGRQQGKSLIDALCSASEAPEVFDDYQLMACG